MFYHISKIDLGESPILIAKIPETAGPKECKKTLRVCFAPTIAQCMMGIAGTDDTLSCIFELIDMSNPTIYQTNKKLFKPKQTISDFAKTEEHWALEDIKVKRRGYIDLRILLIEGRISITKNNNHHLHKDAIRVASRMSFLNKNILKALT